MNLYFRPIRNGLIGALALLTIYFSIVSLLSGWPFALEQFEEFWYFIVSLAIGFGIQIGLYTYFRRILLQNHASGKILATTGATSTAAMLSCCAHYLVNILPIISVTGVVSLIGQYQVELFWVGLAFNLGGIVYMIHKIHLFRKDI